MHRIECTLVCLVGYIKPTSNAPVSMTERPSTHHPLALVHNTEAAHTQVVQGRARPPAAVQVLPLDEFKVVHSHEDQVGTRLGLGVAELMGHSR